MSDSKKSFVLDEKVYQIYQMLYSGLSITDIKKSLDNDKIDDAFILSIIQLFNFNYNIGVEIEAIGIPEEIMKSLNEIDIECRMEEYNHQTRSWFKLTTDSSIRFSNSEIPKPLKDLSYTKSCTIKSFELVSPILYGQEGIDKMQKIFDVLNKLHTYTNNSCGLHIHFGLADCSNLQYVNIFKNYQSLERDLDKIMTSNRVDNDYCRTLRDLNFSECIEKEHIRNVFVRNRNLFRDEKIRYCKVNPESMNKYGTVEFRQHHSCLNYELFLNWVKLLSKLIDISKNKLVGSLPIKNIKKLNKEIETYQKFNINL